MKCTNCGAHIGRGLAACPECGVFARVLKPERRRRPWWILIALIAIGLAGAAAYFLSTRSDSTTTRPAKPIRVVHDRPGGARSGAGATITEPEAILRLRRSLGLTPDCIAILSHGFRDGGYDLTAVNRCDGTRLGHWRVDGKSGAVSRPAAGR